MQFLTVCLLGCFRHFQVKKHISGMCWFDTLSEALKHLIFIQLETTDFGPLVFLYCGVFSLCHLADNEKCLTHFCRDLFSMSFPF